MPFFITHLFLHIFLLYKGMILASCMFIFIIIVCLNQTSKAECLAFELIHLQSISVLYPMLSIKHLQIVVSLLKENMLTFALWNLDL